MSSPNLQEINRRLAAVGLPVNLNPQTAAKLKEAAPRERVLNALSRVEQANDAGARAFLDKTLQAAGLLGAANDAPPPQPVQQAPEPPPMDPEPAPPRDTRQNRSAQGNGQQQRARPPQHHVYGGKAALTFELDETTAGVPTVALDGANSVGERKYDWGSKVRIQFTTRELPVVAAVFLGIMPECSFQNHGPANDKGFSIAWQPDRQAFFVKVWQGKGNLRAVPMPREDAFYVAQIVIRAIQQGSPARLDTAGTIACIRAFYGRS